MSVHMVCIRVWGINTRGGAGNSEIYVRNADGSNLQG